MTVRAAMSSVALALASAVLVSGQGASSTGQDFHRAVALIEDKGDCTSALKLLEPIGRGPDRALAARALVHIGSCHERLGVDRARRAYQEVIDRYPDQRTAVAEARARLRALARRESPRHSATTLRKFLSEDVEPFGYLGADGRFLALIDNEGRLALRDVDGGTTRVLFPLSPERPEGRHCEVLPPVVTSPAGDRVAYACALPGSRVELRVAPTNRPALEGQTIATAADGQLIEPREWIDATRLLAQLTNADASVSFIEVAIRTGAPRTLATLARAPGWFSRSPDGRFVAFDAPGDRPATSHVVVRAAASEADLFTLPDAALPVWAPDGSQLLYVSDRTGSTSLWGQPVSNGEVRGSPSVLYPDLGRVIHPAGMTARGAFLYLRQTGMVDVYVAELDESGRVRGSPSPVGGQAGSSRGPSWSRDNELVYLTEFARAGTRQMFGMTSPATGLTRRLPTGLSNVVLTRWAHDGRRLVARGTSVTGQYGLHVIDLASSSVRPLIVLPPIQESSLALFTPHPTEPRVIYSRFGRPYRVLSRDLDTSEERVLFTLEDGHRIYGPAGLAVSAVDGSIAFIDSSAGGALVRLFKADGTFRDVVKASTGDVLEGIAWMPDGASLLITKSGPAPAGGAQPPPSAWRVDVSTGTLEALGIAMPGLRLLSASPDGRRLAFTAGWPRRELWALDQFLRASPYTTWPLPASGEKP